MPPTARTLPHDLLARICSLLPPGDAILTVPRLNKALAAAAAPRVAELRKVAALQEEALRVVWGPRARDYQCFSIPLWALQEAWPQLTRYQRAQAAARAACHGDLATLRWALPQRDDYGNLFCAAAAAGGQLEALQCARASGCAWDDGTCTEATGGGHLAVLQWARAQQPPCPWDGWTCSMAAQNGHLAVLQWARAQQPPCPWDARGCFMATRRDEDHATAEWIRAQAALEGAAL